VTQRYDLVAVGDVMLDVVAPELTERPRHAAIELRAGGSSANAARAAVAAGRSALVVGCVGDDALAELVRTDLAAAGVEAQLAVVRGARTGRAVYAGDRVVAERGANAGFAPAHVPAGTAGGATLVSGYQLLRDDSVRGARAAFGLGGVVGVDLGSAALVRSFGAERSRAAIAGAAAVFGAPEAIAELGAVDGALLVETLGADGARSEGIEVRPPRVARGAPVGAGDAFASVFLLALADRLPVRAALERGVAAGAAVAVESAP
jgi:sugar/nucleoside kinase (ribokinase family)